MSSILFEKKRANINGAGARLATILVGLCLSAFWLGQPFLQRQIAAEALAIHPWLPSGIFSLMVLLGGLLSIFFIRLGDWRRLSLIAGLVSGAAVLLPGFVAGNAVLWSSVALAGLFAGFGLSVVVTCLGDTATPVRSFAGLLLLLGLVSTGLEQIQETLLAGFSFQQGLLGVAAAAFVAIPLSRLMPSSGSKRISLLNDQGNQLSAGLLAALAGSLLLFLGSGLLWYLCEPLASAMALAVSAQSELVLMLAGPVGAMVAAILANRAGYAVPFVVAAVILLAALALLQFLPGETGYLTGFSLVAAAVFFAAAYVLALIAQLDGSGRFAPLLLVAPLAGLMLGHLVAGKFAAGENFLLLWGGTATLWVVGTLLLLWAGKSR